MTDFSANFYTSYDFFEIPNSFPNYFYISGQRPAL